MRRVLGASLIVTASMILSGCGTVVVHASDPGHVHPYAGMQYAARHVPRSWNRPRIGGEVMFWIFDLPFSLAGDTLLLPWDLGVMLMNRRSPASGPQPQGLHQDADQGLQASE